jgi:hypothetical protein
VPELASKAVSQKRAKLSRYPDALLASVTEKRATGPIQVDSTESPFFHTSKRFNIHSNRACEQLEK